MAICSECVLESQAALFAACHTPWNKVISSAVKHILIDSSARHADRHSQLSQRFWGTLRVLDKRF